MKVFMTVLLIFFIGYMCGFIFTLIMIINREGIESYRESALPLGIITGGIFAIGVFLGSYFVWNLLSDQKF